MAYRGGASTTGWRFLDSRGPCEQINNCTDSQINENRDNTRANILLYLWFLLVDRKKTAPCSCPPSPERRPPLCSFVCRPISRLCSGDATANTSLMFGIYSDLLKRWSDDQHKKRARNLKIKTLKKSKIFWLPLYCSFWSWAFIHTYSMLVLFVDIFQILLVYFFALVL